MSERVVSADADRRWYAIRVIVTAVVIFGAGVMLTPAAAAGRAATQDGSVTTFDGSCRLVNDTTWEGSGPGSVNGTCTGSVDGRPKATIAAGMSYTATKTTGLNFGITEGASAAIDFSGTGYLILNAECLNQHVPCPEIPFSFTAVSAAWTLQDGSGDEAIGTNQATEPNVWSDVSGEVIPPNQETFVFSFSTVGTLTGTA